MQEVESRVLDFIRENNLLPSPMKLVVAVSGGPDSVCLLHVLYRLRSELKLELHVAHLNHQLRGADSEADASYVSDLAARLNLPATIEQDDVMSYKIQHRLSLEEAAREVRYRFLARVAGAIGSDRAAVGHTTDDHIETILLHLIRGAGTRGLRGLQPCNRWKSPEGSLTVIRPLLNISRRETVEYCEHYQLHPRIDVSNLSLSPLRNRIRHRLLPLLKSYNPRIKEGLLRTARIAAEDLAFIKGEVSRSGNNIVQKREDAIILDKRKFLGLAPVLQRYLLLMSIDRLRGNIRDIEMRHIEGVIKALTRPAGRRLSLPGNLIFAVEYDRYLISRSPEALVPFPVLKGESELKVPGETRLPGWHIVAELIKPEAMKPVTDNYEAYMDFDKTGNKLTARSRRPGDEFQPLGMGQTKKLGEFMIDARIPRTWRPRIPIVSSPGQIVWVAGWRIDDRIKVTHETKHALHIRFESASDLDT